MRKWLPRISIAGVLIAITFCLTSACFELGREEFGENATRVDWLPKGAHNVSFYKSYSWTAYEFDIPEADFLKWSDGWKVEPVTRETPRQIARYHFMMHRKKNAQIVNEDDLEAYIAWRNLEGIRFEDGWYYGYEASNGGGTYVGYDRKTGRAYYQSSPR